MTLTVRFDETLAEALARHCAEHGVTKSRVVQESVAAYLLAVPKPHALATSDDLPVTPSPAYLAFQRAGLLGTGELGGRSADKAAVRARAMQRRAHKTRPRPRPE